MAEEKYKVVEPNCGLKITDVKVYPFTNLKDHPYARAVAQVILNDGILLRGLKVMEGLEGMFIGYPPDPYYKGEDYRASITPIKKDVREYIEAVVLNEYEAVKDKV